MGLFRSVHSMGLTVFVVLALLIPGTARAQSPEIMPVSQVKIGMKGYGLTVFKGTRIEKFHVEVLGILKRQNAGGDLILVRMSGGPITLRGANIIGGMSGSPVYINGKVVGAVAYGMTFPKEPIALLTPMQDMVEALDPKLDTQPSTAVPVFSLETPLKIGGQMIEKITISNSSSPSEKSGGALEMVPLSTPLMVSGVSQRSLRFLTAALQNTHLEPVAGPGSAQIQGQEPPATMQPGAAVGVQMMRGDINMTGIGTLSYRKGNRILAFGHPMLGTGTVDMPLTTACIFDVFPSVMRSFKMGAPINMVGSVNQDRPWAVAGTIGRMPKMIPVTIQLKNLSSGRQKTLRVEVMNDKGMTLPLILTAASEGIFQVHPNATDTMARVRFEVSSDSFPSIVRENIFFDPMMIDAAALRDLIQVLGMLTMHPNQTEKIRKVNLSVEVWDKRQTAAIQRIFLKKNKVEPGEAVEVGVVLKPYQQEEVIRSLTLKIPETAANGSVSLVVSGGGTSVQVEAPQPEQASQPGAPTQPIPQPIQIGSTPMELKEMMRRFLERDKNNDLVAKMVLSTPGVNIKGEKFLGLPATLAEIYRSPKATGMRTEREEIKTVQNTEWVITGVQSLSLTVQRKAKAEKSSGSKTESPSTSSTPTPTSIVESGFGDDEFGTQAMAPLPAAETPKADNNEKPEEKKSEEKKENGTTTDASRNGARTEVKKDDTKPVEAPAEEVKPAVKTVVRQPARWTTTSQADFEQGSGTGTAVSSTGDVRLARTFQLLFDPKVSYVWSLAAGPDGIYAGTGSDGFICKIDASGGRIFAKIGSLQVQAVAVGNDGTVYASTAPDSVIYRIGPDGKPVKLFDAEERYITAMVIDGSGALYAATGGGTARIYKIGPDGSAVRILNSPESHILSLSRGTDGSIYAGTGESGLIYKISPNGMMSVIYDSSEQNITALTLDTKGNLYAGTGTKGVLYRVAPDGTAKKLFDKFTSTVTSLTLDSAGNVLAASGSRIFAVASDETVTIFDEIPGAQFTSLLVDSTGNLYAGTANTGVIYRSGMEALHACYESSTHDAGSISRWGQVSWNAVVPDGTAVRIQTRTGNSAEPDDTWSPWSPDMMSGETVLSPPARFIQYRATLISQMADKTPQLKDVTISYLPKNQAPTVTISAPAANMAWSRKQTIKWTASDPDKDTLTTEVFSSADNGSSWVSLAKLEKESEYSWDTSKIADGTYLIKVVVSDRKSNAADALTAEKISEPVVVSNKAPAVSVSGDKEKLPVAPDKTVAVSGRASAELAAVVGVEWQVNGNGWSAAAAEDGIFDSRSEGYTLKTEALPSGENNLEIKVTDAAGNSTIEKLKVKVP